MTQGLYSETKANFVSIKNAFSCKYQKTQPTGASNKGQSLLDYVKSGYTQSPNWFGIQMMSRLKQWSQLVPLLQAWPHITHPKAGNTWRSGSEHVKLFSFNGKEKKNLSQKPPKGVLLYLISQKKANFSCRDSKEKLFAGRQVRLKGQGSLAALVPTTYWLCLQNLRGTLHTC